MLPKPLRLYPVIIYAHGSNGSLMEDGTDLRQIAELGLATVSLEYNQTNEVSFVSQFESLLRYITRQKWADTNAITWVGCSLSGNSMLNYALEHPKHQPQLLILLSGAGTNVSSINPQSLTNLNCPTLLVHGEKDNIFPAADSQWLASVLQTHGLSVELKIIPGARHDIEPNRELVFRSIGEYCLTHLTDKDCWQKYRSITLSQAEAPPFWLFYLPAAVWIIICLVWFYYRRLEPPKKAALTRGDIILRWFAFLLAILASTEVAIHLVTPHFLVNRKSLSIARRFLVQPKEQDDFDYLVALPFWHNQKLKTLLDHAELANYNRKLINWQLDDKIYQDDVLSPVINGISDEQFDWRRPLWEEFYPRIRHESTPQDAAEIVVRHLRERITIAAIQNPPHVIPTIWLRQITDKTGFEIIYVAALRSVGVPARLDAHGQAEIFAGAKWQSAPQPAVTGW